MILVLDDHPLARQGLETIIKIYKPKERIVQAGNIKEAVKLLDTDQIELIFVDVNLGHESGFDFLNILRKRNNEAKVILITSSSKQSDFIKAREFDVDGYVLKDAFVDEIIYGLSVVERDGKFYSSGLIEMEREPNEDEVLIQKLTKRELEILMLLSKGCTNMRIAKALTISEGTVKKHTGNIFGKLLLKNRVDAVLFANKNLGIIQERVNSCSNLNKRLV